MSNNNKNNLVDAIKTDDDNYSKVRGLHYWKDGIIQRTPNPPLLRDLDAEMPGIAWDLLPMDLYRAHNWHCFGGLNRGSRMVRSTPHWASHTALEKSKILKLCTTLNQLDGS